MNMGLKYSYGESSDKDFYITMEINLQYLFPFAGNNNYYINVTWPGNNIYYYASHLSGNLISPCFSITVHYKVHKKKNSMYL